MSGRRPNVLFRVDGSAQIGTGHLRRCMTLAAALRVCGVDTVFAARDLGLDVGRMLEHDSLPLMLLDAPSEPFLSEIDDPPHAHWAEVNWRDDADETIAVARGREVDIVIVDHYAFDYRWHLRVRGALGARIVAIDDLGDRELAVDLIVDHNFHPDYAAKHRLSRAHDPVVLGGPTFALLSDAYARSPRFTIRETVKSVGIFMGGSDIANATATAFRAVRSALGEQVALEIVATGANPHLGALRELIRCDRRATLSIDLNNLAAFFLSHDLQIGAGGGATWERCCLGVPTIAVAYAENHVPVLEPLDSAGVLVFSKQGAAVADVLAEDVRSLAGTVSARRDLSRRSQALVDGRGSQRVALAVLDEMLAHAGIRLRKAVASDALVAHGWRNAEATRRFFRNSEIVALDQHLAWWQTSLSSSKRHILVGERSGQRFGVLRFDINDDAAEAEVSLYVDPERIGEGLGSWLLRGAIVEANKLGLTRLTAEVDPMNALSERAFARTGFAQTGVGNWMRTVV